MVITHRSSPAEIASEVAATLRRHRFRFHDEADLQAGVERVLRARFEDVDREAVLNPRDRPDFMVEGCVVVECKIAGPTAALTRQLYRYAELDRVRAIVAVVGLHRLADQPEEMAGVPVHVVRVGGLL